MTEISYHINQTESEKSGILAIQLLEAERYAGGLEFNSKTGTTVSRWKQLATPKDLDALKLLAQKDVKFENSLIKIPYSLSIQALKWLAASGKFYYNQKQLICDFFTPVEFYYLVSQEKVQGMIKFVDKEFDITSCDFICFGSQVWFIKGSLLKLIKTDVSWKDVRQLYTSPSEFSLSQIEDIEDDTLRIVYANPNIAQQKNEPAPLPILKLKDRSGAFADLWMDYGHNRQIAYHEQDLHPFKRDIRAEKSWEQDLLETGYLPKIVGQSHYYCPLDQVAKSLSFLLEIGWNIQDSQGKKVLLYRDSQLDMSLENRDITIKGKLRYEEHETDLKNVVGAFTRRERFVEIGTQAVGLLPDRWNQEGLTELFEEGEIAAEGIKLKKHQLGTLGQLLQQPQNITLDNAIHQLKTVLTDLNEIPHSPPSASFKANLRPYQQQGVDWINFLSMLGFNGILADDMGLGKTVQVLAFLSLLSRAKPTLIVMPTSLIFNWKNEIGKFLPDRKVLVYHGPHRNLSPDIFNEEIIILTSYATMRLDIALLQTIDFAALILDEAQSIKNSSTQVAQSSYQLKADFRLLLTGTPIENHLGEIWSHFHFLMPELLGDEKSFYNDLQAGLSDSRYIQRIKKKIRPFILRRKKADVAKDLPDCIEQTVWVEMPPAQRRIYEAYLAGIKTNLFVKVKNEGLSKHRLEVFEAILRLRQICCHPLLISSHLSPTENLEFSSGKMESLLQDLENAVEENSKVLVYSQFTSMLHLIAKEVKSKNWNYVYLDGNTQNREAVVTEFQNNPSIHLFLISLKAGGTGLNLTAADYVCIFDPWWNEAAEQQAINRAHRIGRKTTVFAKRYAMLESIEEKLMRLKEQKKILVDTIFDDEAAFGQLSIQDFAYLLE